MTTVCFTSLVITSLSEIARRTLLWEKVVLVKLIRLCLAHSVAQVTLANRASPPPSASSNGFSNPRALAIIHFPFLHLIPENKNAFILQGLNWRQTGVMLDAKLAWLVCPRLFWLACDFTPCILPSENTVLICK